MRLGRPILTLLLGLLLNPGALAANNPAYFRKFESRFLKIADSSDTEKGSYPWWAKLLQSDLLKYDPSGSSSRLAKACETDKLILTEKGSLSEIKDYFHLCEPELETFYQDIVSNTYLTVFMKLQPTRHPFAQHVILNLPGGVKVKGLLALKGDGVKRPLVLLRLGIFSNTSEFFPERSLFMQLFEQSPFNVLLLESLSGSEYIEHNEKFSIGGFDEGLQNFWIARQLKKDEEPLSRLIDSVHLVGMSLGGHGTFFAALLNQYNDKPISSFMSFCPVVNFAETFNYHLLKSFTLKLMNFWASARLPKLRTIYPQIRNKYFVADVLAALQEERTSWDPEYNELRWPRDMSNDKFMERQSFWFDFRNIETPFLIFATKKDPIVPFALNSEQLYKKDIGIGDSNLEVIPLENGYHCSIPAAYNWAAMTTVMQKYIKIHSTWTPQVEKHQVNFDIPSGAKLDWEVDENGAHMTFGSWLDYRREDLPIDVISAYKFSRPLSSEEQSLLRRWLYQNVRVNDNFPSKGPVRSELIWEY